MEKTHTSSKIAINYGKFLSFLFWSSILVGSILAQYWLRVAYRCDFFWPPTTQKRPSKKLYVGVLELLLFPMLTCGGLQGKRQKNKHLKWTSLWPRRLQSLHPRCKLQWPQPEIGCWHSSLASMAKVLATQWRNLAVAPLGCHTPKPCRKTSVPTIGTFNRLNPAHQRPTPIRWKNAGFTPRRLRNRRTCCWKTPKAMLAWEAYFSLLATGATSRRKTLSSAYSVAANHSKSGFKVGDGSTYSKPGLLHRVNI